MLSDFADPFAQHLQATRELRFHGLCADAEPARDLGVSEPLDEPQSAHRGSFGRKIGEGAIDRGGELRRFQVRLDLRRCRDRERSDAPAPAACDGGALQPVARRVANREEEIVPDRAGGQPFRPPAPDPEEDLLRNILCIVFGADIAKGERVERLPVGPIQGLEGVQIAGANAIHPRALRGVATAVIAGGWRQTGVTGFRQCHPGLSGVLDDNSVPPISRPRKVSG